MIVELPSSLMSLSHPPYYARRCARSRAPVLHYNLGGDGFRVFVVSDLHTDYPENRTWLESLSPYKYKKDLLLVAGDVAETVPNFLSSMSLLKDRFRSVFFVPGNHDLSCRRDHHHRRCLGSAEKLNKLLEACALLGVETKPMAIDALGIIPLFSWYHQVCKDFRACKWPEELSGGDTSLAFYFDAMNEEHEDTIKVIQRTCSHIISFSHFVPRQELCPEKRMLYYPNLPKIIGSDCLEDRIRSIHGTMVNASMCQIWR